MTPPEFKEAFERLQRAFANRVNPQPFSKEFGELMWQEVKDLSTWNFKKIINGFIGENLRPKLSEIRLKARSFRINDPTNDERKELTGCMACEETPGYVFAFLKNLPGAPYVFRCHCNAGQSIPERYPVWSNAKERAYTRE